MPPQTLDQEPAASYRPTAKLATRTSHLARLRERSTRSGEGEGAAANSGPGTRSTPPHPPCHVARGVVRPGPIRQARRAIPLPRPLAGEVETRSGEGEGAAANSGPGTRSIPPAHPPRPPCHVAWGVVRPGPIRQARRVIPIPRPLAGEVETRSGEGEGAAANSGPGTRSIPPAHPPRPPCHVAWGVVRPGPIRQARRVIPIPRPLAGEVETRSGEGEGAAANSGPGRRSTPPRPPCHVAWGVVRPCPTRRLSARFATLSTSACPPALPASHAPRRPHPQILGVHGLVARKRKTSRPPSATPSQIGHPTTIPSARPPALPASPAPRRPHPQILGVHGLVARKRKLHATPRRPRPERTLSNGPPRPPESRRTADAAMTQGPGSALTALGASAFSQRVS